MPAFMSRKSIRAPVHRGDTSDAASAVPQGHSHVRAHGRSYSPPAGPPTSMLQSTLKSRKSANSGDTRARRTYSTKEETRLRSIVSKSRSQLEQSRAMRTRELDESQQTYSSAGGMRESSPPLQRETRVFPSSTTLPRDSKAETGGMSKPKYGIQASMQAARSNRTVSPHRIVSRSSVRGVAVKRDAHDDENSTLDPKVKFGSHANHGDSATQRKNVSLAHRTNTNASGHGNDGGQYQRTGNSEMHHTSHVESSKMRMLRRQEKDNTSNGGSANEGAMSMSIFPPSGPPLATARTTQIGTKDLGLKKRVKQEDSSVNGRELGPLAQLLYDDNPIDDSVDQPGDVYGATQDSSYTINANEHREKLDKNGDNMVWDQPGVGYASGDDEGYDDGGDSDGDDDDDEHKGDYIEKSDLDHGHFGSQSNQIAHDTVRHPHNGNAVKQNKISDRSGRPQQQQGGVSFTDSVMSIATNVLVPNSPNLSAVPLSRESPSPSPSSSGRSPHTSPSDFDPVSSARRRRRMTSPPTIAAGKQVPIVSTTAANISTNHRRSPDSHRKTASPSMGNASPKADNKKTKTVASSVHSASGVMESFWKRRDGRVGSNAAWGSVSTSRTEAAARGFEKLRPLSASAVVSGTSDLPWRQRSERKHHYQREAETQRRAALVDITTDTDTSFRDVRSTPSQRSFSLSLSPPRVRASVIAATGEIASTTQTELELAVADRDRWRDRYTSDAMQWQAEVKILRDELRSVEMINEISTHSVRDENRPQELATSPSYLKRYLPDMNYVDHLVSDNNTERDTFPGSASPMRMSPVHAPHSLLDRTRGEALAVGLLDARLQPRSEVLGGLAQLPIRQPHFSTRNSYQQQSAIRDASQIDADTSLKNSSNSATMQDMLSKQAAIAEHIARLERLVRRAGTDALTDQRGVLALQAELDGVRQEVLGGSLGSQRGDPQHNGNESVGSTEVDDKPRQYHVRFNSEVQVKRISPARTSPPPSWDELGLAAQTIAAAPAPSLTSTHRSLPMPSQRSGERGERSGDESVNGETCSNSSLPPPLIFTPNANRKAYFDAVTTAMSTPLPVGTQSTVPTKSPMKSPMDTMSSPTFRSPRYDSNADDPIVRTPSRPSAVDAMVTTLQEGTESMSSLSRRASRLLDQQKWESRLSELATAASSFADIADNIRGAEKQTTLLKHRLVGGYGSNTPTQKLGLEASQRPVDVGSNVLYDLSRPSSLSAASRFDYLQET